MPFTYADHAVPALAIANFTHVPFAPTIEPVFPRKPTEASLAVPGGKYSQNQVGLPLLVDGFISYPTCMNASLGSSNPTQYDRSVSGCKID
jgi:hypothetical protein